MNPPVNPSLKQNPGPTVATISMEPRTQDVDVAIITHGGAMTREDSPFPQIQLAGKNKVQLHVDAEKDTLFEAHDVIRRDMGKFPIYEMPTTFYSTLVAGPSQQYGTLHNLFER